MDIYLYREIDNINDDYGYEVMIFQEFIDNVRSDIEEYLDCYCNDDTDTSNFSFDTLNPFVAAIKFTASAKSQKHPNIFIYINCCKFYYKIIQ